MTRHHATAAGNIPYTAEEEAEADANEAAYAATSFASSKAAAVEKTYLDVDAVYRDAVGNRTTEYQLAEAEARTFKAAGYTGDVPISVSSYAASNPTGSVQTAQWAADIIIAAADSYHAAEVSMRAQRFVSQAAMRAAITPAELAAAVATWDGFIATLRTSIGL